MELTKMDGMSKDMVAERLAQLKALIPEAFTEGKIDFDALKGALGEAVDSTKNHYSFTWNKKEEYRAFALRPSMGTLRPCVAESSGKDGTPGKFDSDNLYIEGDNLEVLKLLQGSYYGKVKMIYIDPPYNTGKDFVYEDDFHDSVGNYKAVTGQTDDEGRSTRANAETSGRYHTDWLNMMFPRLLLARNLLREDGFIFISIGEAEVANLRKLCDEVFGEVNFVENFLWKKKGTTSNVEGAEVSALTDSTLCYRKSSKAAITPRVRSVSTRSYPEHDEEGQYRLTVVEKKDSGGYKRDSMKFPIMGHFPREGKRWQIGIDTARVLEQKHRFIYDGEKVQLKIYDFEDKDTTSAWPNILEDCGSSDSASQMVNVELFGCPELFDNPKPVELVKHFAKIAAAEDSLILDFFSGSATTAHAAMEFNAEDCGSRKFIMVQLPEVCEPDSEAANAGYKNICEIGKERIRRAGAKIKAEVEAKIAAKEGELKLEGDGDGGHAGRVTLPDIGFKVFKLDTSNLIPWNPNPEDLEKSLLAAVDNAVEGRTVDDILYEVLLKCNLPLTLPIEKEPFGENTINVIGEGALMICLDKKIPATVAEEMIRLRDEKYKPVVPMQVVFLDNGFTDKDKANAIVTLKQAGVEEKAIMSI